MKKIIMVIALTIVSAIAALAIANAIVPCKTEIIVKDVQLGEMQAVSYFIEG